MINVTGDGHTRWFVFTVYNETNLVNEQCFVKRNRIILMVITNFQTWYKALAKRPNIVGPTFEICLGSKMFDRLATSKNIDRPTLFACVEQKMFLNFFEIPTPNQKHHATKFVTFAFQAVFLGVAKRSNICCTANLKCWTNNVWSFGQGLSRYAAVLVTRLLKLIHYHKKF